MDQETQGVIQYLEKLVEENTAQSRNLQKQLRFTRLLAIAACALAGQADGLMEQVSAAVENADQAISQVTQTLTEADKALLGIQSMFDEDGLMNQTGDALAQAMEKVDSMDIESLNKAIRDLGDVVEPLADFFNKFH